MITTVLVTNDSDFEDQVKRVSDGEAEAARWWDDRLPRMEPAAAAREITQGDPAVVVIGPGLATAASLALAEELDLHFPGACVVLVAKATGRLWEQALRAGIREIIPTGSDDPTVLAALTRIWATAARRQMAAPVAPPAPRGRVIVVISPKGGAGKTTVSTNLAAGLAGAAPGRVAIVDLDLQFGDVASALGIGPQSTMADAARAEGKLDSTAIKVFLEPHPSGLYALVGPHFPAEADEVSPETAGHVVDILAAEFSFVVVDTAAGLDEHALAAVERADDLVLVCVTDVPSVRALRKALDALDLLGMTKAHRHLVLNRSDDKVGLSVADVEATVGVNVSASVPTSRSLQISVNQGSPVVLADPRSPAGRALRDLANRFVGEPAAGAATGRPRRFARKDNA